ncbi:homodimeric glycerol 3-phosphate dehydrogenase (quinone) [Chromohalobacter marismortui]|uniref:Homodimeric glycerol 3-phosphate dehydrogenase (Quinone) n=1 Tax=Chromohalobacter marismortui TaxID=42055 RepID=A0A4R7NPU6_9GAMM|nr:MULTISPECIES: glycerol-3-phosphate dehydrogenase [Chromohalobacter]MCI0508444.1 glycerol-3-phosphate dehydrogenase [Chromohalobacter sp.]MCI0594643.1 glycerol-3-phosphate dehydrogenase [Chromohalobacter sp.]TDU22923.1 homodimeric glycerol 3-phosphate dehydrogenase (quinone) [Chromohalobacter marismortui]
MNASPRQDILDLFVIGGGINGTGIANEAAGRGLRVALSEQHDLASATSSASSKLIHGGLRYLEHREFRLVREALHEREVLLRKAPHIVWPLRFILPHQPHLRPAWMIRAGLFLYDHLSQRDSLPASKGLRFGSESPLKPDIKRGFEYSDCWVDDARLVVLNAVQAREHGADIQAGSRCIGARVEDGIWHITLEDVITGKRHTRFSRALVNAAGPWVERVVRDNVQRESRYGVRMIQGSHIVVPRLNTDERAYILQNQDRRIVFVLPYQQDYSLIGTTDVRYQGDPRKVSASRQEIDYLLDVVNQHFTQTLSHEDIVTTFSGVRPLCDDESADPSAMTRDYTLDLDTRGAPLLSVFGGKITTYRKLAEAALEQLSPYFHAIGEAWTADAVLPGGDIDSREAFTMQLVRDYPFLGEARARRFASSYGSRCLHFLQGVSREDQLGEAFGAGLTQAEVDYQVNEEWARSPDDILWRRTKLGLRFTPEHYQRLTTYLDRHCQGHAA